MTQCNLTYDCRLINCKECKFKIFENKLNETLTKIQQINKRLKKIEKIIKR